MSDHGKSDRNSSDHLITRALRALRKDFRVIISITFIALSVGVIRKDPTTWAITLFILAAALVAVWTKK